MKFNLGLQRLADKKFDRAKDKFVEWRATYSHGMSYYDLVYQPAKVIGILVAIDFMTGIPRWVFWAIVPFWFVFWYALGYVDRFHLKVWQRQSEWDSRKINPYQLELMKRIKKIERMVKKWKEMKQ